MAIWPQKGSKQGFPPCYQAKQAKTGQNRPKQAKRGVLGPSGGNAGNTRKTGLKQPKPLKRPQKWPKYSHYRPYRFVKKVSTFQNLTFFDGSLLVRPGFREFSGYLPGGPNHPFWGFSLWTPFPENPLVLPVLAAVDFDGRAG